MCGCIEFYDLLEVFFIVCGDACHDSTHIVVRNWSLGKWNYEFFINFYKHFMCVFQEILFVFYSNGEWKVEFYPNFGFNSPSWMIPEDFLSFSKKFTSNMTVWTDSKKFLNFPKPPQYFNFLPKLLEFNTINQTHSND